MVENFLRKFWICKVNILPIDLLANVAESNENTGTVNGPWTSKGLSAHQFFIRYFSGFNLRVGIVVIYLALSETGWRYLAIPVSAIDTLKVISRVNSFIIAYLFIQKDNKVIDYLFWVFIYLAWIIIYFLYCIYFWKIINELCYYFAYFLFA